ncbi:hypothetical protein QBC34DRAFT_417774 [Podospora aff. communis PSN243]|uniref:MYND-type domain-containing protein n=1 Tax=Podospora aff. communis PSN243 TaxID=3040156 RepID=A0AAV9G4H6_9PEZI|nr:hypothetical protein QBC34DRAFT_417774 [Podospora aff. communis PSN243]
MPEPQPKHVEDIYPKVIPKHCEICKKTDALLRCSACKVYFYCGRDHQVQDRPTHKSTCKTLSTHFKKAEVIKEKMLAADADAFTSDHVGNFWMYEVPRSWLQARYAYAEMLIRSWRLQGIEEALAVYQEVMKFDRGDRQGVRRSVPGLLVRLGRDQEAYDFCAWYQRVGNQKGFDWNDVKVPMLDSKGADVTEGVEDWTKEGAIYLNLDQTATVTLIKMRLMGSLQDALLLREKRPDLSVEAVLAAVKESNAGDVLERHPEWLADVGTIKAKMEALAAGLEGLYNAIGRYNKHYWRMVLLPGEKELNEMPGPYSAGSWDEAQLALMHTYSAWVESPMAIPALRGMLEAAHREATGSS